MTDTRPHTDTDRPADGNVESLRGSTDPDVRELFTDGEKTKLAGCAYQDGRIAGLREAMAIARNTDAGRDELSFPSEVEEEIVADIAERIKELEAE